MRVQRIAAAASMALTVALAVSNCSETEYISQPMTDIVHVHGTVLAWRCQVGYTWGNDVDTAALRFSPATGESAVVTFIRDNGFTTVAETDDSSDFDLRLSAGAHKIVVRTGYSYPPDTFYNVQLRPGDTTLWLDIVYAVDDPLHISCVFFYRSIADTAGASAEWKIIEELNKRSCCYGKMVPVFNIEWDTVAYDYRTLVTSEYVSFVYFIYDLPICRFLPGHGEMFNVMEAFDLLQGILDQDTTGFFPPNFSLYPTGVYGCLATDRTACRVPHSSAVGKQEGKSDFLSRRGPCEE